MTIDQLTTYAATFFKLVKKHHGNLDDTQIAAIMGYAGSYILNVSISTLEAKRFAAHCVDVLEIKIPVRETKGERDAPEDKREEVTVILASDSKDSEDAGEGTREVGDTSG